MGKLNKAFPFELKCSIQNVIENTLNEIKQVQGT